MLSGDDVVAAIKAELIANPNVDESACAAELDVKPPEASVAASAEDLKAQEAADLKEAKAMGAHSG